MRTLRNYDVASYYPSLMIQNGYASRSIPSFDFYKEVYETRIAAKKRGDKDTANAYKLILNTCYGATLNRTNPLYDPLHARSVCISGQLYLLELAEHLYRDIPGLKIPELNTDGIEVEFDEEYLDEVHAIVDEWQQRTHFGLEEEIIEKVVSKDVNNYVQIIDGEVKVKGGMLVRGIAPAGAFNINNNAVAVANALREYLAHGVWPEETIDRDDEILHYQFIAKASHKYKEVYHMVGGERIPVQKCNRVYATMNDRFGTLIKVHAKTGRDAKIAGLPEHCRIDNDNQLDITDIDKSFYVAMAWRQIEQFLGYDPRFENKEDYMADKKMNIYEKLTAAKLEFLSGGVSKGGKNMHMAYKFFELDDIVPVVTRIFEKYKLCSFYSVDRASAMAKLTIIDAENPEPWKIEIECPFTTPESIKAMSEPQRDGAAITYTRRYLWMMAMDICEADEMDGGMYNGGEKKAEAPKPAPVEVKAEPEKIAVVAKPAPKKIPATAVERKEIAEKLTDADGNATELQVKSLKEAMKKVLAKGVQANKDRCNEIMIVTQGFKKLTKTECEAYLKEMSALLEG